MGALTDGLGKNHWRTPCDKCRKNCSGSSASSNGLVIDRNRVVDRSANKLRQLILHPHEGAIVRGRFLRRKNGTGPKKDALGVFVCVVVVCDDTMGSTIESFRLNSFYIPLACQLDRFRRVIILNSCCCWDCKLP